MTTYTIVLNDFPIGIFSSEVHRDEAFEKYVKPNLSKKDSFLKGVR